MYNQGRKGGGLNQNDLGNRMRMFILRTLFEDRIDRLSAKERVWVGNEEKNQD